MLVAFLNYLFHPVLGRMMDVESFGEVQAILSLSLILAIFTGVFRNIVINIASNASEMEKDKEAILMLEKFSFYIILSISFLVVIFSPQLKTFFNFTSIYPFIALAVLFIFTLSLSFRQAILQGLKDFKSLSISNIIMSGGRVMFATALVYLGFSAFGAVSGLILAQIVALGYALYKTKHHWGMFDSRKVKISSRIKKELKYGLLIFISTLCITFFYSADVIIIKHYFPPDIAGVYSGIATIARIVFFVTASVAGVLLPSIKLGEESNNKKILKKAFILVFCLGSLVLLTFWAFPAIIVRSLIGTKYLALAPYLPKLSLLLFVVSVLNLFFSYFQALRSYFLAPISIVSSVAVLVLSYFNHDSIGSIINNFLFGSVLIVIFLFIVYVKKNLNTRSSF